MATIKSISVALIIWFSSCTSNETEHSNSNTKLPVSDTNQVEKSVTHNISDTIKRLVVDDYPVTNEMFAQQRVDNSSTFRKVSGLTESLDKVWFGNDTLKQTLVFELYTDYHRLATFNFYNNSFPPDLIKQIELNTQDGEVVSEKQKQKDFQGFLNQTVKINSTYFVSDKGFKLGDNIQKAIKLYGTPDEQTLNNGFEKLVWKFTGDNLYDGKENLKGKALAQDSYGHQITMFFKGNKLVGQILYNDIP